MKVTSALRIIFGMVALGSVASLVNQSSGSTNPPCIYKDSGALPSATCTPGAINHAVTQATIKTTICKPGWSTAQRPPETFTEPLKLISMRQYGYVFGTSPAGYEYDHLIPISLGGDPRSTKNLWPEPHHVLVNGKDDGSYAKDKQEAKLYYMVCHGQMKLWSARKIMRLDWRTGD